MPMKLREINEVKMEQIQEKVLKAQRKDTLPKEKPKEKTPCKTAGEGEMSEAVDCAQGTGPRHHHEDENLEVGENNCFAN